MKDYFTQPNQLDHIDSETTSTKPVFIAVDFAKPGSDKTLGMCPTCLSFQEYTSPDYRCKKCGKLMIDNMIINK